MSGKPTDKLKAVFDGAPDLDKEVCSELVSLYDRKLWHELTQKLRTVFDDEAFEPYLHDIFIGFVSEFGHKLNLLSFAKFAHSVAKDMDQDSAVMLLKKQVEDMKELKGHPTSEPILLLEMSIAEQYIDITHMDDCKELLDSGLKKLDEMSEVRLLSDRRCSDHHLRDRLVLFIPAAVVWLLACDDHLVNNCYTRSQVDPAVSAAVHNVAALFAKARQDFSGYYRAALQFLCYVSLDDLPQDDQLVLARDISLAALLGDSVYSFAELLLHPVVRSSLIFCT